MYYVYMIRTIIISLLLIGALQVLALFLIKEFDKFVYIKDYKQDLKKYLKPVYYLYIILTYLILLFSSVIGFIILIKSDEITKNQYKIAFTTMFVTPIVGIGISVVGSNFIYKSLYDLEFALIPDYFAQMMELAMFIIIPYYIILGLKQAFNMYTIENKQLEQFCGYKIINKKMVLDDVLSSAKGYEYIENHLKFYETEKEWKESDFVTTNYKYYANLIAIVFSGGTLLNFMLNVIINKYIFVNTTSFQGMFLSIILLVIIYINWLINRNIILVFKKNCNTTKKMTILFILSIVITLGLCPLILEGVLAGEILSEPLGFDYQKNKEDTVSFVQNRNDHLNYTYQEKMNYIFDYPDYFIDDLKVLNYIYDERDFRFRHEFYEFYAPIENEVVIDGSQRYYENETEFYMILSPSYDNQAYNINLSPLLVDEYGDWKSEPFYYIRHRDVEKNYVTLRPEFHQEFHTSAIEESEEIIDRLWNEEMKDRGLV